jgi:hypothetical protein
MRVFLLLIGRGKEDLHPALSHKRERDMEK